MRKFLWRVLVLSPTILIFCSSGFKGRTLATSDAYAEKINREPTRGTIPQTNISELSQVEPSSWAFQALKSLGDRYTCAVKNPDGTPISKRALTRYEFAAGLNNCLDRVNQLIAAGNANSIRREDLTTLRRLQEEFAVELATLRGRVDALESRPSELEADRFSTTPNNSGQQQGNTPFVPRASVPASGNITVYPLSRDRTQNVPVTRPSGGVFPMPVSPPEPNRLGEATFGLTPNFSAQEYDREGYNRIYENPFERVSNNALSTFGIDVDTASYSNIRRFITSGTLPPKDAVRLEELINYFTYDYPQPEGDRPFSITTEVAANPWNSKHKLVHIGLQGKSISTQNLPPNNLVFLIDVSGSMNSPDKLPLVKASLKYLVNELRDKDKVTIVVYAGAAGLVLPPTPGNQKEKILNAIEELEAGGSTAGGAGIELAYKMANENLLKQGNNRVILATDGDFNVGTSSDAELVRLIEEKREQGVFLTVLGFGTGNLQDAKMEQLADKGNGNYAYIDSMLEAKKVLVNQMGGTLFTIAKDVKIQVEFNPAKVQAYRLIGYENRRLQNQDFNDDKKDAGELGAGHSVTALYEIIPVGVESDVKLSEVDELKYQQTNVAPNAYQTDELMQVKLRYKKPSETTSNLIKQSVIDRSIKLENASVNFRFSAAVAAFGMVLRDSEYKGEANFDEVLKLANQSKGEDKEGYRAEFIRLVESCNMLVRASK
ncbi:VWA domain-containing protein [Kamptonema sp. UHCC 0994]|uniref:VWA domain-containing protein n=1 Tax=Kamptonema sp. UHCC 0994 TaxID=3031329 RepID=UPI0023B948CF|nr:VWA domain-containing protein [Kamptonema sp. UHCC 0994]MDF0552565.1 von Willebrand factor type A domain-containing protein [Kamptonema sp. UHCC 0994]